MKEKYYVKLPETKGLPVYRCGVDGENPERLIVIITTGFLGEASYSHLCQDVITNEFKLINRNLIDLSRTYNELEILAWAANS